jgi:predicted aldo/keto reductase-like oxidoreductase
MQYRNFGKTGFQVSALSMGCMRLPRLIAEDGAVTVDREKAFELIRYAADNGVNYFDNALTYHAMGSEAILGEALEGERRKRVKLATKQLFAMMATPDAIRENLEATLKKLRTDYIDFYLIHNIQAGAWEDIKRQKIIEAYEKFKAEGLIRNIGFSYHGGYECFADILGYYDWAMCQVQYNLLDTDREVTTEAIKLAGEKGCALVVMEPLKGGGLANAPRIVQDIYDTSGEDRTPAEWALRYLTDFPQISTVLSGMSTLEQLKENIAAFSAPDAAPNCLTPAQREMFVKVKAAYESIVTIPCTACEYCLPCPSGVGIPNAFGLYNEGMMFGNFDQPRRSYMFATRGNRDASLCTRCGACEPLCPQGLAVMDQLEVAHEALKGWFER